MNQYFIVDKKILKLVIRTIMTSLIVYLMSWDFHKVIVNHISGVI